VVSKFGPFFSLQTSKHSPSHQQLPDGLKLGLVKPFSQNIHPLGQGLDVLSYNALGFTDVNTEEMALKG
jgi:hypothetical protein